MTAEVVLGRQEGQAPASSFSYVSTVIFCLCPKVGSVPASLGSNYLSWTSLMLAVISLLPQVDNHGGTQDPTTDTQDPTT